ncbi:MAG: S8 family serine peptidase [Luteolibacter sp.]|jgi:hypothetical protein|nr:S8 family serine peptidase [Luteolibacter sp.]
MKTLSRVAAISCVGAALALGQIEPKSLIYSGNYQDGAFESLTFVNSVVGWDLFFSNGFRGGSTVIGNVEGGHIWYDHEAFIRAPEAPAGQFTHTNTAPGSVNELDFHATTVGHVLAGSGYVGDGAYTYAGLGMAPDAKLVSGAISTGFSTTELGVFSTTEASVIGTYRDFFTGNLGPGVATPDVINSSWGGADPAGNSNELLSIDGLARQHTSVAFVVAAGNGGGAQVSAPASGFNNISVGSVGGPLFREPSSFSSSGLADFHNPESGVTLTGVRAAVDIAAPGERLFLAAYLGNGGSIGAALPGLVQQPSPTDRYFLNMDGTSYSSPIVAGGIALLKDAAKTDAFVNHVGNDDAFDTRVIKSVLMASSQKTAGWNNGQNAMNVTTQALDAATGAGLLDLARAVDVYFLGTRELSLDGGGQMRAAGWDAATISLGSTFEYLFSSAFSQQTALTVALNWFSIRDFDDLTNTGSDIAFSNLDLEVWSVDEGGEFLLKVGASISTY